MGGKVREGGGRERAGGQAQPRCQERTLLEVHLALPQGHGLLLHHLLLPEQLHHLLLQNGPLRCG